MQNLSKRNQNINYTFTESGYLLINIDVHQAEGVLYLNGYVVGICQLYYDSGYNHAETNFVPVKKGDKLTSYIRYLGSNNPIVDFLVYFFPYRR